MHAKIAEKMAVWTDRRDRECGGFMYVDIPDDKSPIFQVVDITLPQQLVTGSQYTPSPESIRNWLNDMQSLERLNHRKNRVLGWWHSHGRGEAFFSPTDNKTIDYLRNTCKMMVVSIITTQQGYPYGNMIGRIDFNLPYNNLPMQAELDVLVIYPSLFTEAQRDLFNTQFDINVVEKKHKKHKNADNVVNVDTSYEGYT